MASNKEEGGSGTAAAAGKSTSDRPVTAEDALLHMVEAIESAGGIGPFFRSLDKGAFDILGEVFGKKGPALKKNFLRLSRDSDFAAAAASALPEQKRDIALRFLREWDAWRERNEFSYQLIKLSILGGKYDDFNTLTRLEMNAFFSAVSSVSINSYLETLHVQTVVTLVNADKKSGGDDKLVMSGSFSQILSSLDEVVSSMLLSDKEKKTLDLSTLPENIKSDIQSSFSELEASLSKLRGQFGM